MKIPATAKAGNVTIVAELVDNAAVKSEQFILSLIDEADAGKLNKVDVVVTPTGNVELGGTKIITVTVSDATGAAMAGKEVTLSLDGTYQEGTALSAENVTPENGSIKVTTGSEGDSAGKATATLTVDEAETAKSIVIN